MVVLKAKRVKGLPGCHWYPFQHVQHDQPETARKKLHDVLYDNCPDICKTDPRGHRLSGAQVQNFRLAISTQQMQHIMLLWRTALQAVKLMCHAGMALKTM
eukprot:GHUV01034451.1.p4 GENE.GHUV01034451.1~~GHUV01034451.1.p4  ORF type:complete len:101 (+),score=21.01 GHUV01034451.1:1399-1701(+)